jgi:hypothetical protein
LEHLNGIIKFIAALQIFARADQVADLKTEIIDILVIRLEVTVVIQSLDI